MTQIPPSREITIEIATEFESGPFGTWRPANDGKDVPGWEYRNYHSVDGKTLRVPTCYIGFDYDE